jgi:hypothetical protein
LFRKEELLAHRIDFSSLCGAEKEHSEDDIIGRIQKIFQPKFRRYLKVFRLGSGASLTNAIFGAVLESMNINITLS